MGPPSQKVLNWLHNVLISEYRHVNRTYSDIAQSLSYNPWISLKTEVYTFEQGNSSLLLNLHGSLPVSFRGATYAFPISLWVPREYPQVAPMNFVTPTNDMVVRPGQHVSGEGRIYHPYLAGWRDDRSNIAELIAILQDIFSKEPPLVARREHISKSPPVPQRNGVPPPVPPLPPELGRLQERVQQSPSFTGQPPPPPPKPFEAQRQSVAHRGAAPPPPSAPPPRGSSYYGPPQQVRPDAYSRDLQPRSQDPPQGGGSAWDDREPPQRPANDRYGRSQQPQRDAISPISPQTAVAPQRPWAPDSAYPQQARNFQTAPKFRPRSYSQNPQGDRQVPPSQQALYQQQNLEVSLHQQPLQQQPSAPQKPKPPADLLTSPFEAALPVQSANVVPPPIPPNPQKDALLSALSQTLAEQVRSTHASNLSAIAPLHAQQAALTTTLNNVNTEISQLNELEKLLLSNETILHQAMRDADNVLEDAKKRQIPNVDEVLFAPTVVARQLYEAVADERAVEDCRTVLAKALDNGRIGGGVWAKQTRSLAREEFLKKALIKKISRGMGLVEEDRWS